MPYLILITFFLAPTYTIKFSLIGLPTNFLMLWVVLVWAIFSAWLIAKNKLQKFIQSLKNINKKLLFFIGLFFLSGTLSLFVNNLSDAKLGQFIVLILQPISIFFISKFIFEQFPKTVYSILYTAYCLLSIAGLLAIFQYFTLIGLPETFWGNNIEPKRAVAFFTHPNFYALFSAPLLALLIPDLLSSLKANSYKLKATLWTIGSLGLLLSFSRAGWLGLGVAIIIYLIFKADKQLRKISFISAIVIFIILISIPNFRYRLILPFYGEKSTVSRLSLWTTGFKAVKEAPVLGLGLNGFSNNWTKLNTDPNLDTHNFPHNIFLSFWVETGLLGLISFLGIVSLFLYRVFHHTAVILRSASDEESQKEILRFSQDDAIRIGVALFFICLLAQGQIDNPYFKNDLAMVFWIVLSLI